MGIDLTTFLEVTESFHSAEAERGAANLIQLAESGEMALEILPTSFTQFTGELEKKDFISYREFLNSANGRKIIDMLERSDEEKLFEL